MSDMVKTIQARADQLNADDLVSGPITVTVERVSVKQSSDDQPVSIYLAGEDPKKPWKPCKTFRRVLVDVWGADSRAYVGKSMTLFRNPDVMFGGEKVGGIEISHMSGLKEPRTIRLTATRGKKRPITIKPLEQQDKPAKHPLQAALDGIKIKWSKSRGPDEDKTPEAFCQWVQLTSDGQVLSTDALSPGAYNDTVIAHLVEVLG